MLTNKQTNVLSLKYDLIHISNCKYRDIISARVSVQFIRFSSTSSTSDFHETDKQKFVMMKWATDFPTYKELNYKDITGLASRSNTVSEWYSSVTDEYAKLSETPEWYLDTGGSVSDWDNTLKAKSLFLKDLIKNSSLEKNKLSLELKARISNIDDELRARLRKELVETPELVLELITPQSLPLETHLKAMEYSTKEDAKAFIKREHLMYKKKLHSDYLKGKLTSTELVELMFKK
jgi:hypothetical protein